MKVSILSNFSERMGYIPSRSIQLESIDETLFNRIWNIFYVREFCVSEVEYVGTYFGDYYGATERIFDSFGFTFQYPNSAVEANNNTEKLRTFLLESKWYFAYDFIEKYIQITEKVSDKKKLEKEFNQVLEEENAGYRVIQGIVTPITNNMEFETLQQTSSIPYRTVRTHFLKALSFYSDRVNPDYENSIKESITAVEAMCCTITGEKTTLNKSIKKLKAMGIHIHPCMENAMIQLYSYTCDENGIRHGGMNFANAPSEDAKYMLVSCSAFVNYLVEKYSKVLK